MYGKVVIMKRKSQTIQPADPDTPHWSERQRLAFIERMLFWRGWINRRDLIEFFGISMPQSSNDLVAYQTINPTACLYNTRRKRYEVSPSMQPILIVPDFGADMQNTGLAGGMEEGHPLLAIPEMPPRSCSTNIFRRLSLATHAKEAVEIRYFSIHSGKESLRWISPRTFVNDGLRWHVRAYCHEHAEFRDFVVGRIASIHAVGPDTFCDLVDEAWSQPIEMVIGPSDNLPETARRALEMDYGMENGTLCWTTRQAVEVYVRRRLGFADTGIRITNDRGQLYLLDVRKL
jgi:hypothetical protein